MELDLNTLNFTDNTDSTDIDSRIGCGWYGKYVNAQIRKVGYSGTTDFWDICGEEKLDNDVAKTICRIFCLLVYLLGGTIIEERTEYKKYYRVYKYSRIIMSTPPIQEIVSRRVKDEYAYGGQISIEILKDLCQALNIPPYEAPWNRPIPNPEQSTTYQL